MGISVRYNFEEPSTGFDVAPLIPVARQIRDDILLCDVRLYPSHPDGHPPHPRDSACAPLIFQGGRLADVVRPADLPPFRELVRAELAQLAGGVPTHDRDLVFLARRAIDLSLAEVKHGDYGIPIYRLGWRAHRQLAVLDLAFTLMNRGLLSPAGLAKPMNFDTTQYSALLLHILDLLQVVCVPDVKLHPPRGSLHHQFSAPLQWLAILIVRSGSDLAPILDALWSLHPEISPRPPHEPLFTTPRPFEASQDEALGVVGAKEPAFGFFLPHGVPNDAQSWTAEWRKLQRRANAIKEVFNTYFRIED